MTDLTNFDNLQITNFELEKRTTTDQTREYVRVSLKMNNSMNIRYNIPDVFINELLENIEKLLVDNIEIEFDPSYVEEKKGKTKDNKNFTYYELTNYGKKEFRNLGLYPKIKEITIDDIKKKIEMFKSSGTTKVKD